jgi:energy-coupling factor transporter transmembrane protein EcfT
MMLWVLVAAALTILLYAIFGPTTTGRVVQLAGVRIAIDPLLLGVVMAAKLVALLLLSNVLLRCVSPLALATGITGLLMPLRYLGVPLSNFFYLAFFLTRMIPNLLSESRLIALAQRSRGVPTRTWTAYPALALPMFASALRRSDSMTIVLTSRGFDTSRIPAIVSSLRFTATDYLALTILTMGWALWIYLQVH